MFESDRDNRFGQLRDMYTKVTGGTLTRRQKKVVVFAVFAVAVLFLLYQGVARAPAEFPEETIITVTEGAVLSDVAEQLKEAHVVRSAFLLQNVVILLRGEKEIFAGDYFFNERKNVWGVARMITTGEFGLVPVTVTLPEGATAEDIAVIFVKRIPAFNDKKFLKLVEGKEGYLFPDTYFFLPNVKAKEVAITLEETFFIKLEELDEEIAVFGKPIDEIVIMASLLEKEARTTQTRRMIAGILWKRLGIGMPLQVDAVFVYINGKNTFQLTLEDLSIDSPYNTYRYKGLPIGPIANPGLDSLRAAVTPIESDNLYYLSDKEGNIYYSETFEEHKRKKRQYLN